MLIYLTVIYLTLIPMQTNDPVQLERWQRLLSSATANWIGGAMSNYAADGGTVLAEVKSNTG